MVDLKKLLVGPDVSVRQVIECIDRNAKGIAMVVDDGRRLIGTVTDGDIRRAILAGVSLELEVSVLLERKASAANPHPVTAPVGTTDAQLLKMMSDSALRHIPLVDEAGRVADVALLGDLVREYEPPLTAVVMAGGFGTRLLPLTEELPKPMLPVGDRPLLELTIEQLRQSGIRRVNVTTHYRRDVITQHFGDGREFGVDIQYVEEEQPLGTAGAISLMEVSEEPLLVINGDILTKVDYRTMLDFHREHGAEMTVAVREQEFRVPFGVVETDGTVITGISEKPVVRHFINAGIYLLNPAVCRMIPNDQSYDMPDLIAQLVGEGRSVVSFPIHEYWLDIGHIEDYQKAREAQEAHDEGGGQ